MHALCQDDFGPSRMCTSKEFWLSLNAEAPLLQSAWLHPEVVAGVDFSGAQVFGQGQLSCFGWASTAAIGLVVTTSGKAAGETCLVAKRVTCCVPIQ